jgi:hypothetical protein
MQIVQTRLDLTTDGMAKMAAPVLAPEQVSRIQTPLNGGPPLGVDNFRVGAGNLYFEVTEW